jgi:3-phenylpropionate/trans-cinnamate dioxygenase ferredoxin reductase subunit
MSTSPTFVIVGAGLAGAKAAETLRAEGFDGRLLLFGDEAERPYDHPPLSKAYLRGETDRDSLYVHEESFYAAHGVELRTSTPVRSIDPGGHRLELASGEQISHERLLLATGATPRRLPLPGADLAGVQYLRTRSDADALAAAAARAEHVVVVGTGWIGSEAAASLRQLGRDVTLIGPDTAPLARVLGPEVGGVYRDLHADHGVRLALGTRVAGFRGRGRVEAVVTDDGRTVEGDLVLVGAGAAPRTELAEAAGLPVRNGLLVNEQLEAVGAAGVYAAGDVAAAWHPRYQSYLRVEHWANALNQGPAAARNMLGIPTPYARLPYFYSDQYDLSMEYSGFAATWDRVVVRGDPAARQFIAFWLKDQRVVAGMNANVWDVTEPIQALIRGGLPVDPARLADPGIPLDQVTGDRAGGVAPVRNRYVPRPARPAREVTT